MNPVPGIPAKLSGLTYSARRADAAPAVRFVRASGVGLGVLRRASVDRRDYIERATSKDALHSSIRVLQEQ